MYGMQRIPNDVDIVVLTNNYNAEEIKEQLVSNNPNFFLLASRNHSATHRVLHYSLYSPRSNGQRRSCKVDILIPRGALYIPSIPIGRVTYTRIPDVPVMPLLAVLMLKVQGWLDHRTSHRRDFQEKVDVDVEDIHEMLNIAVEHEVGLDTERWMPRWFVSRAIERVNEFMAEFPDTSDDWSQLGFE